MNLTTTAKTIIRGEAKTMTAGEIRRALEGVDPESYPTARTSWRGHVTRLEIATVTSADAEPDRG